MTRSMRRIVWISLLIACQSPLLFAEQQFRCPNDGEPKPGVTCLPGQPGNAICGEGYSCFFSGQDYQCCPTHEDPRELVHGECPDYTIALLDANGQPVRCSTLGDNCPKDMYCNEQSPVPICCQGQKPSDPDPQPPTSTEERKQKQQAIDEFFNKDEDADLQQQPSATSSTSSPAKVISEMVNVDCPKHALVVLNEDGDATLCSKDDECPQSGMFCFGETQKICCESMEPVSAAAAENAPSPTKSEPASPPSKSTQTSPPTTTVASDIKSVAHLVGRRISTASKVSEPSGKAAASYKKSSDDKAKEAASPKVFASKTVQFDEENAKPIHYRPHNSGGYAVSNADKLKSGKHVDKKEVVQQYLLEQIKQGWPYDERFYRPENMEVVEERGRRPASVVHFP